MDSIAIGYSSTEGQKIIDSFRLGTQQGDVSLTGNMDDIVVFDAADLVLQRVGGKVIDRVAEAVNGELTVPKNNSGDSSNSTKEAGAASSGVERVVTVRKSCFPGSAQHIEDAIGTGKPGILTIERENTASNRRDSLRGSEIKSGLDRDGYPPAIFQEGG